jgi:hypothetical protein
MTRVFNLSELMVRSFGVSDPVTGGVETREDSASDSDPVESFCRLNERHRLSFPTIFPTVLNVMLIVTLDAVVSMAITVP